jgi:hypothetical protein
LLLANQYIKEKECIFVDTPWSITLLEKLVVTQLVKTPPFMEPEGSLS